MAIRPLSSALFAVLAITFAGCPAPPAPYLWREPPDAAVPEALSAAGWKTHLTADLLPFWMMDEALGSPVGNFPTWRGMDGSLQGSSNRRPRMLGRQTYTYAIGFLITGDEAYLDLARAGTRWLIDHGWDGERGGWHALLDAGGESATDDPRFAQDMSYAVMGPAAYFFVTRDPDAEAVVLQTRDLLFDPALFWDEDNGRIRDGMNAALTAEAFMGETGSWELVAQLDPITAFLLLTQPALTEPARREQVLADLRALGEVIRTHFATEDGTIWGTTGGIGSYGSRHTDFGHMLKAYWALLQIDKRLADHPFHAFVSANAPVQLRRALDEENGRWAERPSSDVGVRYGNAWWSYAESDQLAATLALNDPQWVPVVAQTAGNFVADFVDDAWPARELIPNVRRDGSRGYNWPRTDTAKANEWKNGFHGAEHALVLYLLGHYLADVPAPLYFAFPAAEVQALGNAARPYTFEGRVAQVEDLGPLVGDPSRHKVRVSFDQLR